MSTHTARAALGLGALALVLALALFRPRPAAGEPTDDGAPIGTVAFFDAADLTCPPGWGPVEETVGRLVIAVKDGAAVGKTVGTPLGDQEDRTHSHDATAALVLPYKSVSAADGSNQSAAAAMTFNWMGATAPAPSGLPFIQLLACVKR